MVSIKHEFEKEVRRFIGRNGLGAKKEAAVRTYYIECKKGFFWYVFAQIKYSSPWGKMRVCIMENAPEDEIRVLKKFIETVKNKFNICFSFPQTTSKRMYSYLLGTIWSIIVSGFFLFLVILSYLRL